MWAGEKAGMENLGDVQAGNCTRRKGKGAAQWQPPDLYVRLQSGNGLDFGVENLSVVLVGAVAHAHLGHTTGQH